MEVIVILIVIIPLLFSNKTGRVVDAVEEAPLPVGKNNQMYFDENAFTEIYRSLRR